MSTINTILIKRRLESSPNNNIPQLSGGELAFSEKNHTLYYGGQYGTLTIGGSGAFVHLDGDQTVSGNKTFSGTTTLSSTTFSPNSLIDVGGNLITNLAYPTVDDDAATKKYVDDNYIPVTFSGDFVNRTDAQDVSGVKTYHDNAVFLSSVDVFQDLTVKGNFTVLGNSSVIETTISATSAISISNTGTGPALYAVQTGNEPVAVFYDDADIALYIDGKDSTPGYVGVGTETPNEKLTVSGNISASGNVYGVNGDFSGTLDVVGATTLQSTLDVTSDATFASSVSAQGALTVDGTTTLNDDLTVTDVITVNSSTNADNILIDGTNRTITISDNVTPGIPLTDYKLTGITASLNGFTIDTDSDNGVGINFTPYAGSHTNITQGNLNVLTGDLSGNGSNSIKNFIIDGGSF